MSVDETELVRSLESLLVGLPRAGGTGALTERLEELVAAAQELIAVDCVGLLLLDADERPRTVAATGPAARSLEHRQEAAGVGPGIDALRGEEPIAVSDLETHAAYAQLYQRLDNVRVHAVLAAPVLVGPVMAGNLNLLRFDPHVWTDREIGAARAFAGLVGTMLGLAASGHTARNEGSR